MKLSQIDITQKKHILIFNMELTELFFKILEEQNILKTRQSKPIVDAIESMP